MMFGDFFFYITRVLRKWFFGETFYWSELNLELLDWFKFNSEKILTISSQFFQLS